MGDPVLLRARNERALEERRLRVRNRNGINRLTVLLVVAVAVVFASFFLIRTIRIRRENEEYAKNESVLLESKAAEESRKAALESEKERELTTEEKIEIARRRFGLIFPNEILFLPVDQ